MKGFSYGSSQKVYPRSSRFVSIVSTAIVLAFALVAFLAALVIALVAEGIRACTDRAPRDPASPVPHVSDH